MTNASTRIENLTSSAITNISPTLTNVFDTMSVEIYSLNDPTKDIWTGDMRLCDLHNREFYIYQTVTNTTQVLLNLVLLPYRTNITTTAAYSNDTNLLSKETLSLMLDQFDDQLNVRFRAHRHRALSPAYAIDPTLPFLGYSGTEEMDVERPLRKGDQAAICMSYGQVTPDMLQCRTRPTSGRWKAPCAAILHRPTACRRTFMKARPCIWRECRITKKSANSTSSTRICTRSTRFQPGRLACPRSARRVTVRAA